MALQPEHDSVKIHSLFMILLLSSIKLQVITLKTGITVFIIIIVVFY